MLICGLLMLLPVVVALLYSDGSAFILLIGACATIGIGAVLNYLIKPNDKRLRSREGFIIVALSWICLGMLGAIPFYLSGFFRTYIDCVFETVSGFTTTGATVLTDIEAVPKGILFWRSLTHWIGGMGILVLTMALIPQMGSIRSLHILRAESTGPNPDKIVPKTSQSAKTLYGIYIVLTLIEVIILKTCGLSLYDAFIHTFSTAGTGGFSSYNLSVGHFRSASVDIVVSIFMLLFSLNFTLYYRFIHKEWNVLYKDTETRVFFGIVVITVLLVAFNISGMYANFSEALRHSLFQVSSIISTTGFSTQDFELWPRFSQMLLLLMMLIGGCAGSTAGGIKVIRAIILFKGAQREIHTYIHPRAVKVIKIDGHAIDESMISSVSMYFFSYILLFILSVILVSLNSLPMTETLSSVLACITNTGPGLGFVGPAGNFASLSLLSKAVLTMCMLLGRLDVYPILLIFSTETWKK